jgi:O-antigen/teichoic acid export membrane protein
MKHTVKVYLTQRLDQLGQWLHLDWRYYLSGGSLVSLSFLVSQVAGLLTSVAFARLASKEIYGRYGLVFSLMSIVNPFSLPGMGTAITQSVASGYPRSFLVGTAESFKWSFLGSLGLVGAAGFYGWVRHDPIWAALLVAAAAFPILYGLQGGIGYFVGQKRLKMSTAFWISSELFTMAAVLVTLFLCPQRTVLLVAVSLAASCTILLVFYLKARKETIRCEPKQDASLLSYGRQLSAIAILSNTASYLDRALISTFLGFADLAVFSIAAVFPDNLKGVIKWLDPLILPRFTGLERKQVAQRVREKMPVMIAANIVAVALAIWLTPVVMNIVYSSKYAGSVLYAQLLFVSLVLILPTVVINSALTSQQRTRELYQANLIFALAQIGSLAVLVPTLGLLGAVLGRLVARFCLAAYSFYALWRLAQD